MKEKKISFASSSLEKLFVLKLICNVEGLDADAARGAKIIAHRLLANMRNVEKNKKRFNIFPKLRLEMNLQLLVGDGD